MNQSLVSINLYDINHRIATLPSAPPRPPLRQVGIPTFSYLLPFLTRKTTRTVHYKYVFGDSDQFRRPSQLAARLYELFAQIRCYRVHQLSTAICGRRRPVTGPADWVCHIGTLTPCTEAVAYRVALTWWSGPDWSQALSERPSGFLQCFDTVGLVT